LEFNFESSIRGYHVYKSIWTYEISEKLRCDREENNANDNFAVKLVLNDGNKEHVPIELSKVLIFFLKEVAELSKLNSICCSMHVSIWNL
jgi:isopropylmalate/homocitrate/citramalate synthase